MDIDIDQNKSNRDLTEVRVGSIVKVINGDIAIVGKILKEEDGVYTLVNTVYSEKGDSFEEADWKLFSCSYPAPHTARKTSVIGVLEPEEYDLYLEIVDVDKTGLLLRHKI